MTYYLMVLLIMESPKYEIEKHLCNDSFEYKRHEFTRLKEGLFYI